MEIAASERQIVLQEKVQPAPQPTTTGESETGPVSDVLSELRTSSTQVNTYHALLPSLKTYFEKKVQTFKAGNLSTFTSEWQSLT